MDSSVLAMHGLSKEIGGRPVLKNLYLRLSRGRGLVIAGPNGAGKTTLLQVAAGICGYNGGMLYRFGNAVPPSAPPDGRLGYLGHQTFLYPDLTVEENLELTAGLWQKSHRQDRIRTALREVGLEWNRHERVSSFSQGMAQRAAWARLMVQAPELWILDEPFAGLDESGCRQMARILASVQHAGAAVIMSAHSVRESKGCVEAVADLCGGEIVAWRPVPRLSLQSEEL